MKYETLLEGIQANAPDEIRRIYVIGNKDRQVVNDMYDAAFSLWGDRVSLFDKLHEGRLTRMLDGDIIISDFFHAKTLNIAKDKGIVVLAVNNTARGWFVGIHGA